MLTARIKANKKKGIKAQKETIVFHHFKDLVIPPIGSDIVLSTRSPEGRVLRGKLVHVEVEYQPEAQFVTLVLE